MSRRSTRSPAEQKPPGRSRYRTAVSLLTMAAVVAGAVAMFGRDLVEDLLDTIGADTGQRPLSASEADRLAAMRHGNWTDQGASVRVVIGDGGNQVHASGWVDWRHPAAYFALDTDHRTGQAGPLVQAVPGLIATQSRSGAADPVDPYALPPERPPADGWLVRRIGAAAGAPSVPGDPATVDTLAGLLLALTAEQPDAAELLARSDAQWLRRDQINGFEVDVVVGPAMLPPAGSAWDEQHAPPPSLADWGGAVQYWLDQESRLHRMEALLAPGLPVQVELDRSAEPSFPVVDLLGGPAIAPRPVTEEEVSTLTDLPRQSLASGGVRVSVTVPQPDGTVTGVGWLDWQRTTVYLARSGRDDGTDLVWADRDGVAHFDGPAEDDGSPPLPVPGGGGYGPGWERADWSSRSDERGGFDLDLLINEALMIGNGEAIDPELLRQRARWLRTDRWKGAEVTVFELPRAFEEDLADGQARMRYWVDPDGTLRRIELRTRGGGFGHVDLHPADLPYLG